MTVGELKEALKDVDDSLLVVMSKDAEGNGYSPLADHSTRRYLADSTWSGELIDETEDEEDEEETDEGVAALVLWPTN